MATREKPEGGQAAALIHAQGLRKQYGRITAVSDLTFMVHRGEILGLLGPNGAGKSTALRMLVGFQYPDAGHVLLGGKDVFLDGPRARASLGYLPEMVPLYAEMDAHGFLLFYARLKGVPKPEAEVARVISVCGLEDVAGRPCGNLSRGYRQRVGLAQALLGDPSILILDEPTAGLDPNQIHDFRALVRHLGRDRAVLLSTHILPEAMEVCDRVLILHQGEVVASGSPGQLLEGGGALHWARLRMPAPIEPELERRFMLQPEESRPAGPENGGAIYRLGGDLPRDEARELLALALARDWEVLEWGSGAAGLETLFRRLTLGGERR